MTRFPFPADPDCRIRRGMLMWMVAGFIPIALVSPAMAVCTEALAGGGLLLLTWATPNRPPVTDVNRRVLVEPAPMLEVREAPIVDAAPPTVDDPRIAACIELLDDIEASETIVERLVELDHARVRLQHARSANTRAGGTAAEVAPLTAALDGVDAEIEALMAHGRALHSATLARTWWTEAPTLARTQVSLERARAELEIRAL